ncbi:MAG: aminotransferase class III-fold pyridoxal phosphate-dependent enzyme [Alphaproteobacteria bacterium]|nr:aminotransferase class III-fold pyridoxal phosphate-dependent enzyme [Alphaproteobacteria bacterium]
MNDSDVLSATREHESRAANTFRLTDDPPVFAQGDGPWLITASGERYLDLVCGSATTNLGHGHPAHRRAVEEVMSSGIWHTGTRLPSPPRAELYRKLAGIMPPRLDCFQLANSGAEAVEAAIKAAQFKTGRKRLMAFEGGYHGRTLGALSVTHGSKIRAPFSTLDKLVDFFPFPSSRPADGYENTTEACLEQLETRLSELAKASDLPAAMILEAVQGVSGVIEPPAKFLHGVRDLATRHGVLLIADEIWSGFGRAGRWFAFERSGMCPDLVTLGKALSGGLPLAAVAGPADILKTWPPGIHTSTFQGNPFASAMASATIDVIRDQDLLTHVRGVVEPLLLDRLGDLATSDSIRAVRCVGAQAAIEFVDLDGKPDADIVLEIQRSCLQERNLVYGGGRWSNVLMLLPPILIDKETLSTSLETIRSIIAGKGRA